MARREDKLADEEVESAKQGRALAFLLAAVCVVSSVVFFAVGKQSAGWALISLPVVRLVSQFIVRVRRPD